MTNLTKYRISV